MITRSSCHCAEDMSLMELSDRAPWYEIFVRMGQDAGRNVACTRVNPHWLLMQEQSRSSILLQLEQFVSENEDGVYADDIRVYEG